VLKETHHAGNLPICHDVIFKGVLVGVEPLQCRVSVSARITGITGTWKLQKRGVSDLLELRGYITGMVLDLAGNRVFLSPDDAVSEYNLIPNPLS
jgi:hypothetical protein